MRSLTALLTVSALLALACGGSTEEVEAPPEPPAINIDQIADEAAEAANEAAEAVEEVAEEVAEAANNDAAQDGAAEEAGEEDSTPGTRPGRPGAGKIGKTKAKLRP